MSHAGWEGGAGVVVGRESEASLCSVNCVLPLANSAERFSGVQRSKSSGLVNDSGPMEARSHRSRMQPHRDVWVWS